LDKLEELALNDNEIEVKDDESFTGLGSLKRLNLQPANPTERVKSLEY
jgi:hypothetical protein